MVEGFKNTDIGIIPNNWDVHELGAVASYRRGSFPQPYGLPQWYDENNGMPFVQVFDVDDNMKLKSETKQKISDAAKDKSVFVPKGSIVLTIQGSIGRIAITQYDAYVDRTLLIFQTFKKPIDKWFFMYVVYQLFQIEKAKAPGGTIKTITKAELSSFLIPLPPTKAEQTAIATALNDADALIQKLEQLIAKKRNIKTGAMQELLKPKEGWEMKKLGEIGECIIGLTYSPSNVKSEGKLVLRSSNIKGNRLAFDDNVFVDVQVSEKLIVKKGDILICVRNGSRNLIGKCAYIDGKAVGETFGAFMSVFRSPYNDFVFHAFQSFYIQRQIEETIGATINQLTNKNLNSFEIPFPSIEEQARISQILSDMDNEIQELETELEKYKMMKQGMMQSLLTGKIRLV